VSPGVTIRLRPERTIAGGEALARDEDGRVVFVRGALGGELVDVEVVEAKKDWARARVLEVVEPSTHRVVPPCPQRRLGCGGCDWQHVAPEVQPSMKAEIVVDALRRTGRLE
jgi:23S rRNA (uracil1939-C5)-methyltransferase